MEKKGNQKMYNDMRGEVEDDFIFLIFSSFFIPSSRFWGCSSFELCVFHYTPKKC